MGKFVGKIRVALDEFKPDLRLVDERGATDERRRRAGDQVFLDAMSRQHMRDSPINVALSRGQINSSQYTAGMKFYNHWYRAGLVENFGSSDLNRVFGGDGGGAGMARTEAQAFHRQRYRQAVERVGLRGSWVLERVICREVSFEETGRELGWNNRPQAVACAVQLTRDALDALCKDWGII